MGFSLNTLLVIVALLTTNGRYLHVTASNNTSVTVIYLQSSTRSLQANVSNVAAGNATTTVPSGVAQSTNTATGASKSTGGTKSTFTGGSKSTGGLRSTEASSTIVSSKTTITPSSSTPAVMNYTITDRASIEKIQEKCGNKALKLSCSNKERCCKGLVNTTVMVTLGEQVEKCNIVFGNGKTSTNVTTSCVGDVVKLCTCGAATLTTSLLVIALGMLLLHFYH